MKELLESLSKGMAMRRERERAAREDAREERRLRLEEAREEGCGKERTHRRGLHRPRPSPRPRKAQLLAFGAACPDWEQHAPKLLEYGAKLRPGETDATEYLTLLYRLAKMDAE